MSMPQPVALVIGDVSMVRALGRAGIPVVLATSEAHAIAASSRYCSGVLKVRESDDGLVEDIVGWARAQAQAPVIFYQGDGDLLALSRQRHRITPHAHLIMPRAELVEDLVDKLRFARLARELALPVPETAVLRRGEAVEQTLDAWRHFPCVVKPAVRLNWIGCGLQAQNGGVGKAVRVESASELQRIVPLLRAHDTDCVLQAAVEGGEDRILSYHAYVRPDGEVAAELTGRKRRTRPRQYGYSTCVTIAPDEEVRQTGRDIVRKLAFSGVLKMDFKRDARDGRLFLLEINPRFNLWHHLATVAGLPIPAMVYNDCVNPGAPTPSRTLRKDLVWMSTRGDLRAFFEYRRAGEMSLTAWLREAVTADVHEDLDWTDPLPFFADLASRARKLVPRLPFTQRDA